MDRRGRRLAPRTGHPCALRRRSAGLDAYHCAFVRTGQQLWVVDLRSGKGTRVNGRDVRLGRLKDGDILQAGEWTAIARLDTPPAAQTHALVRAATMMPPAAVASAADQSVAPMQHMIEQFQQCVSMMGQMFTAMQQQHTLMVREQVSLLHDLSQEIRDGKRNLADAPYATPDPSEIPWAARCAIQPAKSQPPRRPTRSANLFPRRRARPGSGACLGSPSNSPTWAGRTRNVEPFSRITPLSSAKSFTVDLRRGKCGNARRNGNCGFLGCRS